MATLEPTTEEVMTAATAVMGILNSMDIKGPAGAYGLSLATYIACKNTLAMTDADYMRFCQHIMDWGQDLIIKYGESNAD